MGGKYEIRYEKDGEIHNVYTNSWWRFMRMRLKRNVIYYKVYCG